jgi:hypothetical protein
VLDNAQTLFAGLRIVGHQVERQMAFAFSEQIAAARCGIP